MVTVQIPSGQHTKNYGKSTFLMGKLIISMAIFNSYVKLPEGTPSNCPVLPVASRTALESCVGPRALL
jgi:hypothetical protein